MNTYDALLVVGFGGPEGPDDVMPFLENVTRGRNVPRGRLLEVAEHYHHFHGKSPINDQVRELVAALRSRVPLPIYWGNRNWHPMLADTVRRMRDDGVGRALALATSAYGSYSGCRQYRENIDAARAQVGDGAPRIDKMGLFHAHPGFLGACADRLAEALARLPGARVAFTAHSIPRAMADGCAYERQLLAASATVARMAGASRWDLVYQSRSGPPTQEWLGPDICDWIRSERPGRLAIAPIGFLSDHLEVLWDLDNEARAACDELGIEMARAATVGSHPGFVSMVAELVADHMASGPPEPCADSCCRFVATSPSSVSAGRRGP
jgi:ferrochelatase